MCSVLYLYIYGLNWKNHNIKLKYDIYLYLKWEMLMVNLTVYFKFVS